MTIESIIRELSTSPGDDNKLAPSDPMFEPCVRYDTKRVGWIVRNVKDGDRVLEVGAGYGYVAIAVARMRPRCTVLATEHPDRAYFADANYLSLLRSERVELKPWIIGEPIDPALGAFQAIVLSEVVEHLNPATVVRCLAELAKVLAPGGVLILSTPNVLRLRNRVRLALGSNIFDLPDHLIGGTHGHLREYSHSELSAMVRGVGLTPELCNSGVTFPVAPSPVNGLIRSLGSLLASFSITFDDEVFILARK